MTRNIVKTMWLAIFAGLFYGAGALADERPKVGLCLSGGSARGFAHIGVIKVLEEIDMPVDVIGGTSMGSVVGGLLACGYTAAEMESLAVSVDWIQIIAQDVDRRTLSMEQKRLVDRYVATTRMDGWRIKLPSGLRSGQELMSLYGRLIFPYQDVEDLPIRSVFVAHDLVSGDPVVLDHGDAVFAVRASMSIPWVFVPVEIEGRILDDGGMVRNLPAEETRDHGADIVIGVDIGPTPHDREALDTMFNVLTQSALLSLRKDTEQQYKYCDVVIVPDLKGLGLADFDKAEEFIARGEQAARDMLPRLQALADSLNGRYGIQPAIVRPHVGPIHITAMKVTGLERVDARVVRTDMGIELPSTVTLDDLEQGIDRVYGSGLFESVAYRIEGPQDGRRLDVAVVEKSQNQFKVGVRLDTRTKGSVRLNATYLNLLLNGSTGSLDVRLAEDFLVEIRHALHIGFFRSLGLLTRLNTSRASFDVFAHDAKVAAYQSTYTFGSLFLGTIFSTKAMLGGGMRIEYIDSEPTIGGDAFHKQIDRQAPIEVQISVDSYDHAIYPTTGVQIDVAAEHSFEELSNNPSFTRLTFDGRSVIKTSRRTAILFNLYFGTSDGEVPFVYAFAMGGVNTPWTFAGRENSFMGLKPQERVGPHIRAGTLGFQYELLSNVISQLRWTIGNTFEEGRIDAGSDRYINGVGITLGLRVLNGKAEVTFSTSERQDFLTHVTIGSEF